MQPTVHLAIVSPSPHTSQVITGFLLLEEQGVIDLKFEKPRSGSPYPNRHIVEVTLDGRRIAFDVEDGYNFDLSRFEAYLSGHCDVYFKRSFSTEINRTIKHCEKIRPLGFNYHVTHRGNPNNRKIVTLTKQILKKILLNREFKHTSHFTHDKFEALPQRGATMPKILFATRLWEDDPGINSLRIDLLRALKEQYGSLFIGGLEDSALSREMAADLIIPPQMTNRATYLETMKRCDICIGSTGLHKSIGWKMGEYVAASRAIVTEKMFYEVPGDYTEGVHYLSFDTPDRCIAHVDNLVENPDLRYEMMAANHRYYNEYLRPDRLVYNAIREYL